MKCCQGGENCRMPVRTIGYRFFLQSCFTGSLFSGLKCGRHHFGSRINSPRLEDHL